MQNIQSCQLHFHCPSQTSPAKSLLQYRLTTIPTQLFLSSFHFRSFFLFVRSLDDELPHARRSRSPTRYYDAARGRQQEEEYLDERCVSVCAHCLWYTVKSIWWFTSVVMAALWTSYWRLITNGNTTSEISLFLPTCKLTSEGISHTMEWRQDNDN